MSSDDRVAVILAHADGRDELLTFQQIARESAQFAHYLAAQGIKPGDRVAVMLEPSRAFYVAMFGAIKYGAIAVPLFTLFGPDGIRLRVQDCAPRLLITNAEKAPLAQGLGSVKVVVANDDFLADLAEYSDQFTPQRALTTWRSFSTRRARRASCRKRSSIRIARSSR